MFLLMNLKNSKPHGGGATNSEIPYTRLSPRGSALGTCNIGALIIRIGFLFNGVLQRVTIRDLRVL